MNKEDLNASIEMNLKQIISLIDLLLECKHENIENLLTIRDLAYSSLNKFIVFKQK